MSTFELASFSCCVSPDAARLWVFYFKHKLNTVATGRRTPRVSSSFSGVMQISGKPKVNLVTPPPPLVP